MNFLSNWFASWLDRIQHVFGKSIELLTEPELLPLELENGEGKGQIFSSIFKCIYNFLVENTIYTAEQQQRKVKCQTKEGKYFEVF